MDEGVQFDIVVGRLNLLLALGTVVLDFLAQSCNVLNEFIKVILGKINAGLFILLYLLKNRFIVRFHIKLCLIKVFNAILIGFESCLHLVLGVQALIHHFLHLFNRCVSLLLVEKSLFDFDLHLFGLMSQIHVLSLGLLVISLFITQVMEKLTGLFELLA